MKSISASIVVLSGALLLVGKSFVPHDQTQVFVQFVGCVVGVIGLVAWWLAFKQSRD